MRQEVPKKGIERPKGGMVGVGQTYADPDCASEKTRDEDKKKKRKTRKKIKR